MTCTYCHPVLAKEILFIFRARGVLGSKVEAYSCYSESCKKKAQNEVARKAGVAYWQIAEIEL